MLLCSPWYITHCTLILPLLQPVTNFFWRASPSRHSKVRYLRREAKETKFCNQDTFNTILNVIVAIVMKIAHVFLQSIHWNKLVQHPLIHRSDLFPIDRACIIRVVVSKLRFGMKQRTCLRCSCGQFLISRPDAIISPRSFFHWRMWYARLRTRQKILDFVPLKRKSEAFGNIVSNQYWAALPW